MKHFQDKRQIRGRIYSKTTTVLLFILLLLLCKAVVSIYNKQVESRNLRDESLVRLSESKDRQNMIENEMKKLQTDEGIEEEIRTKFNVIKPSEHMAIIVLPAKPIDEAPKEGFFARLWHKIW